MTEEKKLSARIVRCPSCGQGARYDPKNIYRPFCSQRCKTMDIAHWAEESYRIPAKESAPSEYDGEEEHLKALDEEQD